MHSLWESPTRQQTWLGGGASHAVHLDVVICHIQPRQTHLTAAVEEVSCREDLTTSTPRNIITPGSPKCPTEHISSPCRDQKAMSKVKKTLSISVRSVSSLCRVHANLLCNVTCDQV